MKRHPFSPSSSSTSAFALVARVLGLVFFALVFLVCLLLPPTLLGLLTLESGLVPRPGCFEGVNEIENGAAPNISRGLLHFLNLDIVFVPSRHDQFLEKFGRLRLSIFNQSEGVVVCITSCLHPSPESLSLRWCRMDPDLLDPRVLLLFV